MVVKIGYCKWCGNENLRPISSEEVYCHNCGEYSRKDKLGYRDKRDTEQIVHVDNCNQ